MKKKVLSLFLVLVAIVLVGCGSKENKPSNKIVLKSEHGTSTVWTCTVMDNYDVVQRDQRSTAKLDKEVDGALETTETYKGLKEGTATIKCLLSDLKNGGKTIERKEYKAVVDKDLNVKISKK